MDKKFEGTMHKIAFAHMEDMANHFNEHKEYPTRAFCYNNELGFTHFNVDGERLEEEMKRLQKLAIDETAPAVAVAGIFILHRGEGSNMEEAVKSCEDEPQKFKVLAIIIKFMDGKTFAVAREVLPGDILDTTITIEGDKFLQLPLKPWGN